PVVLLQRSREVLGHVLARLVRLLRADRVQDVGQGRVAGGLDKLELQQVHREAHLGAGVLDALAHHLLARRPGHRAEELRAGLAASMLLRSTSLPAGPATARWNFVSGLRDSSLVREARRASWARTIRSRSSVDRRRAALDAAAVSTTCRNSSSSRKKSLRWTR